MRRREEKFPDNGFEAWGGYMQAKISKLEEQFTSVAGKENKLTNIFSGVSIYVNGFTTPSAEELKLLMSKHGGVYHTYQRNYDYVIASNLPDVKVKNMSLSRVVRPDWITDSISSNRLLDYREYLLYRNSRTQRQLNFKSYKNENSLIKSDTFSETKNCMDYYGNQDKKEQPEEVDCSELVSSDSNLKVKSVGPKSKSPSLIVSKPHTTDVSDQKHLLKENDPVAKTAADPNFISEFYNNSRLHHISQLGACFKQHINNLRDNSEFLFPARTELKNTIQDLESRNNNFSQLNFENGKVVMHIDMDCFFVSVGLRDRPELRGKPVAVTHSKGGHPHSRRPGVDRNAEFSLYKQKQTKKLHKLTGVPEEEIKLKSRVDDIADEDNKHGSMSEIASCSYEARAKGISNGMFMGPALRLCPELETIPYNFEGYREVAYTLYNTVAQYTLDIEAVSCDEMYVECTELLKDLNVSVQDLATALRNEIKNKTSCPCSTGFGGNRLQARLATKKAKPDGQFFLTTELVEDFMFDIQLKELPGVGRQTTQKLESLGHESCGSLQSVTLPVLQKHLGNKTGAQIFAQCRGQDSNPLSFHTVRKSVSAEVNYGIRFENNDQCIDFLKQLSAEIHSRMLQFKVLGKCITLKLMIRAEDAPVETAKFMGHGFCNVINKSISLNTATNDVNIITKEVILLCKKQNINPKEMRGIGIQVTKLESMNTKQSKESINKFLISGNRIDTEINSNIEIKIKTKSIEESGSKVHKDDIPTTATKQEIKPSTPKKIKTTSATTNKSPIIGSIKSPKGKRRGRPPKNLSLQPPVSKNLMNKFLYGQNYAKDTPYKNPMIKNMEVPKAVQKTEIHKLKPDSLIGLSWEKVRELLRAWLESGQAPLPCDIQMIASYMREMVIDRNIDKVNILLNFLRRRTHELGCKHWIEVYEHVVQQVQNAMIAVYGKQLYISK